MRVGRIPDLEVRVKIQMSEPRISGRPASVPFKDFDATSRD